MTTLLNGLACRRAFGFGAPITTAVLLLAALTARADTAYTATGWVTGVPATGTWYRGTMGTDGSLQLHLVGTGWGGTIDGLRLDETLTRAAVPG